MKWNPVEVTPPHLIYLILSSFLIAYALFSNFIRNRLHLSEPPIALLLGIILGPRGLKILVPNTRGANGTYAGWGWGDDIVQEITRIIVGIQVFATAVELPKYYFHRHWRSVGMLLGDLMNELSDIFQSLILSISRSGDVLRLDCQRNSSLSPLPSFLPSSSMYWSVPNTHRSGLVGLYPVEFTV